MRFYFLLMVTLLVLAGCNPAGTPTDVNTRPPYAAGATDSSRLTSMEWKQKTIDYGRIQEGQTLDIEFTFTNTGKLPLVISKVEPGCGCTVAEVPKAAIEPGNGGSIKGSFNSSGRTHTQHKTLLVYANARGVQPTELSFNVEVDPKK